MTQELGLTRTATSPAFSLARAQGPIQRFRGFISRQAKANPSRHRAVNNYPMITIKHWWPLVAWMSLIFFLSTDLFSGTNTTSFLQPILSSLFPDVTADQIETIHLIIRKLGHWGEYFILAILSIRALHGDLPAQSRIRRAASAIVIATLYAVSDEWHQSFVPSRSASIVDVLIDCFGAICAAFWFIWHRRD